MQTLTNSLKSLSRTMSSTTWTRLIRFVDDNGNETFGEPVITDDKDFSDRLARDDLWAVEYKGQSAVSALTKGEKVHVKALRDLLRPADVPIIKCIGLNYIKHSKTLIHPMGRIGMLTIGSQGGWPHTSPLPLRLHQALGLCDWLQ